LIKPKNIELLGESAKSGSGASGTCHQKTCKFCARIKPIPMVAAVPTALQISLLPAN
jgi:hypothetical protein